MTAPEHPAVTIRQAAERLRLTAGAASEGPWQVEVIPSRLSGLHRQPETIRINGPREGVAIVGTRSDARYIASMSPVFAVAVAGWLEARARDAEAATELSDGSVNFARCDDPPGCRDALAVARAYLGEHQAEVTR